MKSIKLTDYVKFVKPEYVYLKLTPSNSIRNNNTHKLARTIASLYRNVMQSVKREQAKAVKALGKEFLVGTEYSVQVNGKVAYFVYIEKKRIEFYFIVPRHHLSLIREKMSDVWTNVTIKEITALDEIPTFKDDATKYQLVYEKEDAMSLDTDRKSNELLTSNLNVVDVLEEGDKVGIYYNFMPTSQFSWPAQYRNTVEKFKERKPVDRNKLGFNYALKMIFSILNSLVNDVAEVLGGESEKKKQDKTVGPFLAALERMNGGKSISPSTVKKGSAIVLDTQIIVLSESTDKLRESNNARSMTQSFDTISEDNKLIAKRHRKPFKPLDYRMVGADVNRISDLEAQNFIAVPGREILERYNFIDKIATNETRVPEDLRKGIIRMGENIYRGMKQQAYLTTHREYKQLTLVLIGPTRAGKSTYIGNLSHDAIKAGECVILFDFIKKNELSDEVSELFPSDKVLNIECGNPATMQGLGYNEIKSSADPFEQYRNTKRKTKQLSTLVNAINTDDSRLSPKMSRYLQAAANVVFISDGSIKEVFDALTDHEVRGDYVSRVPKVQRENLAKHIQAMRELDEWDKKGEAVIGTKTHLVVGIIDRVNALEENAYMELMLNKDTRNNIDLVEEMQKNQLICLRMPESMFTTKEEKDVYTTYWMTKVWLALQVRGDEIADRNKLRKVNLVIDELYQVENTEIFLRDKLSQIAKFGMKPIISCHYLNQIRHIREELRSANASYMLVAGCDKNNYNELKDELQPFTVEDLLKLPEYHSMNYVKTKDGYGRFITKLPAPVGISTKTIEEDDNNEINDKRNDGTAEANASNGDGDKSTTKAG